MEETLEDLQGRHRKEAKDLTGKVTALRKSIGKGAADKKKKKEVQDEITRLELELKDRHDAELKAFQDAAPVEKMKDTNDPVEQVTEDFKDSHLSTDAPQESKVNRQKKRKEKKEAEMQERVRLAQEEASNSVNTKQVEEDAINSKLAMLNLSVKEIKPDGHCLYSAIADQIRDSTIDYTHIRKLAAEQMRSHPEEYLPFMTNDLGDMFTDDEYASYCSKVESTAEWGGQLEVMALSKALSRQIHIVQMSSDVLKIGEEFLDAQPIMLSYHRHAYGLGEHYNSLVKQQ